ncbi:heavy metal-associated isoprenylated plant protein 16-like isoform X1 [Mangifera indica]|uniref:heavy metal-associated isoprenylated plant protein 16-like isoform X1 n=1 Tax=Mangifera indica TaxID=29780 RepID=UPI001CF965B0|nr:heavy metal-associated isoprenylated plant protein 16-like isoform X1 [Mangifera indica]
MNLVQKVVIKVTSMNGQKSLFKAMKIAAWVSGVESAASKEDYKTQIEITGDGMDAVALTSLLRKKEGYAELVSVGPAGGGDKKDESKPTETGPKIQSPGGLALSRRCASLRVCR